MSFTWTLPYPSSRTPVLAANIVATSQPLAAQAGLRMLLKGGNAVDAAVATAITLTVIEPMSNGLGSDSFAIVWDGEHMHGLNASGRSPKAWTAGHFANYKKMPELGWDAVTVPGAVDAWVNLSTRFGKLPFADLFEPAINYAHNGFPVAPKTAAGWANSKKVYAAYPDLLAAFFPNDRAPHAGEIFRHENQARSLELIAKTKGEAFYRGELAEKIIAHAKTTGGLMSLDDLAAHHCEWVEPIAQEYRGHHVHEIPPNGQGLAALIALGILRHHKLADYPVDSADSVHLQVEAMKLAFAEAKAHIADPAAMKISVKQMLDESYLASRAKLIDMQHAAFPKSTLSPDQGTVYLTAADSRGMMVSMIQSNYGGFGSGIVVPGTGISMQNRGACFTLEKGHPNEVGGNKRPYHTIIPAFVTREGRPVMSFGVMGGHMQPQGHVQMITRIFDYNQNPQAASDAPRWHVTEEQRLYLEPGFSPAVADDLRKRGHTVLLAVPPHGFGGAQLIYKMDGAYCAGSDHRKDGQAVGY
jgi:gamma-glutamyltranspeptidase/glutathione hydrolase